MSLANRSSTPSCPPADDPNFVAASEPVESDIEDEVDQLISDSESPETEADPQNGADGHRMPGQTLLPAVRLENIMSAEGAATQQYQEFMFLSETIPVPIPLSEAISLRAQKEKEAQEADPTAPSSSRLSTSISKKAKSRTNGTVPKHDKRSSASTRELRPNSTPVDSDSTYSDWVDTRPPRAGGRPAIAVYNGRLSLSARPSPLANGHSASTAPSRSSTITPAQSHDPSPSDAASTQHHPSSTASPYPAQSEESWLSVQAPYAMGPASGFLQGPGGPFGRVSQNPGRTIYSQQYRTE
ncbi:hypothetical protein C0995_000136 [Termitomyces sp. Mi166|nr:hypothetical protein C0995_000136 [Termitomyces sp. Mi166\